MIDRFPVHLFHELLLSWYRGHRRDLPWRLVADTKGKSTQSFLRDPYRILVSELMLQQTQVARVIIKFQLFLDRWPTIESLAGAKLSEVITEWKGLGYNRRAKHLLETAKIIVHTYAGNFPSNAQSLRELPGFGPYMVGALEVFAFGEQTTMIDVNIERILTRVQLGIHQTNSLSKKDLTELAEQSLPHGHADDWHQALMDFGALICTAKHPNCPHCPLSRICLANIDAQALGFDFYASWLAVQPKVKKVSPKDKGKRFEETDRYFRGRIIDYLRAGEQPMQSLQEHILLQHNLVDRKRFGSIVESLVIDGLIVVRGNTVSLA